MEPGPVTLPALRCDYMHGTLPTQEAPVRLWCPEFLMGLDHIQPTWLTFSLQPGCQCWADTLSLQMLLEAKLICTAQSPKPPSSIILFNCPLAKAFRQTKTLLSRMAFWGPRDPLPVAEGKSKTSAWLRLTLHYTDREGGNDEWVQIVVIIYGGYAVCQAVCWALFPILLGTLLERYYNYRYFKDKMRFREIKWPFK